MTQVSQFPRKPIKRTRIKSSKRTASNARMKRALDDHARSLVFERDDYCCVRCGKGQKNFVTLQPCHVIGRRHLCTRWEMDNIFTGCGGCHIWWHEYPTLSGEWFRKNWPERHEHVLKLYNAGGKIRFKDLYEQLKAQGE